MNALGTQNSLPELNHIYLKTNDNLNFIQILPYVVTEVCFPCLVCFLKLKVLTKLKRNREITFISHGVHGIEWLRE